MRAGWLLLVTLLLSGCGSSTQRDTLTVFAAASLTDAFEAVEVTYEAQYPSVDLVFNFAGSSTLVTQLDDGAPADVFASANQTQMDRARSAGVIAGEPVAFAGNRLALIVSMGNPAGLRSLEDLGSRESRLVLAAVGVPVRAYTDEMLSLAGSAYGPGWEAAVLDNVVSEEANVRQVAAKVALGEADAGVVYTSDLLAVTDDVTEIPIPDSLNVAAVYTAAPVRGGDTQTAADFIDFLRSETGTAILSTWGFTALE